MKEDKIIGALIGLAGACSNNPKTKFTDKVVIEALALPVLCQELDDEELNKIVGNVHAEKHIVAPDCAVCACPCGNTSDYDMTRIENAAPEIRDIKRKLISGCQRLAARAYRGNPSEEKEQIDCTIFYKILSCVSYDMEMGQLLELLDEVEMAGRRCFSTVS